MAREVWRYSVSGLQVVKSWLNYRKLNRAGKKSSPLDDIRPEQWDFTEELLEMLWVLEETICVFSRRARRCWTKCARQTSLRLKNCRRRLTRSAGRHA